MFKVRDGQVKEVKPALGRQIVDRDGRAQIIIDKVVRKLETLAQMHPGLSRGLNPNGY
jgi:hypothetical protein